MQQNKVINDTPAANSSNPLGSGANFRRSIHASSTQHNMISGLYLWNTLNIETHCLFRTTKLKLAHHIVVGFWSSLMRSNEGSPHQLVFAQHVRVSFLLLGNRETRRLTYPRNKLSQHIGHSNKIHDTQIADGNNPVVARWGLFFRLFSQKHHLGVWSFTDLADMETLRHVLSHFLSPTQCSVKRLSS